MTASTNRVRRATLDDLGTLRPLWDSMHFPVADLEKRLTEFQVVESASGKIIGVFGFQITGRHGRIHSEAFPDFALADAARESFWDRLKNLASNHGILRLWTQENAPFWKQRGLQPANADTLKKLPEGWTNAEPAWSTLQLKDEEIIVSVEKELAMYMESEKLRTAKTFETARAIKKLAIIVGIIFAMFVLGASVYMIQKNPNIFQKNR